MQGCRRACLAQLALWAAIAAGFFWFVRDAGPPAIGVSLGIGLLATAALLIGWGAFRTLQEQAMLVRSEREPPRDGTWCAVSGELRTAAPVRAPLSGESVAMYEYSIARTQRFGKRSTLVTYFDGKSLAASSIGTVRLLSVPALEVEPAPLDLTRAIANVSDYIRRTTFAKRDTSRDRTSALEREWADDDGVFRIDRRHTDGDVDLDGSFQFEERHLKPGDHVCAFGVFSSTRGGIVPDEQWGKTSRIMRGTAREIAQRLGKRAISYALIAIVLAAASILLARNYLTIVN